MKIREIKNENVRDFLLQCWIDTYVGIEEGMDEPGIRKFFAEARKGSTPKKFKQFGAFIKDKLVGYIYFINEENKIILKSLYVSKEQQGKGIGLKLLEKIDEDMPVCLSVLKSNRNARNFYEKYDFKLLQEKVQYPFIINGKEIEEVVYCRPRKP